MRQSILPFAIAMVIAVAAPAALLTGCTDDTNAAGRTSGDSPSSGRDHGIGRSGSGVSGTTDPDRDRSGTGTGTTSGSGSASGSGAAGSGSGTSHSGAGAAGTARSGD